MLLASITSHLQNLFSEHIGFVESENATLKPILTYFIIHEESLFLYLCCSGAFYSFLQYFIFNYLLGLFVYHKNCRLICSVKKISTHITPNYKANWQLVIKFNFQRFITCIKSFFFITFGCFIKNNFARYFFVVACILYFHAIIHFMTNHLLPKYKILRLANESH